jgi:uncharacterized membrane protein YecN with MAPEG domain
MATAAAQIVRELQFAAIRAFLKAHRLDGVVAATHAALGRRRFSFGNGHGGSLPLIFVRSADVAGTGRRSTAKPLPFATDARGRLPPIAISAPLQALRRRATARHDKGRCTMFLPITLTIAGACALLSIWLALRVSHLRRLRKVSIGDGGDERVATRMRAHANFAEYTPIFLILLAAVELAVGASLWLWGIAILFVFVAAGPPVRHGAAGAQTFLRIAGTALTWLALLALGAWAIALTYMHSAEPPVRQLTPAINANGRLPPTS